MAQVSKGIDKPGPITTDSIFRSLPTSMTLSCNINTDKITFWTFICLAVDEMANDCVVGSNIKLDISKNQFFQQQSRFPGEVLPPPSLRIFKTHRDKTLSNLIWTCSGHCFEQEIGLGTPWGPFQPELFYDSWCITGPPIHFWVSDSLAKVTLFFSVPTFVTNRYCVKAVHLPNIPLGPLHCCNQ